MGLWHRMNLFPRMPLLIMLLCISGCAATSSAMVPPVGVQQPPLGSTPSAARDLGRLPGRAHVSLLLSLRDTTAIQRQRAIAEMYDPRSRRFGHFQSPAQWAASGPSLRRVAWAQAYLHARGIASHWQRGADWLMVTGPSAAISRVFRVRIDRFRASDGRRLYAALRSLWVPTALQSVVSGAGHLSSYSDRRATVIPTNGLDPTNVVSAYDMQPLRTRGMNGSGQTVAFIEIDGFHQADFDAFTSHYHLPAMRPVIKAGSQLSNVDGEAEMDLEVVHEIAPQARLLVYNCSSNCSNSDIISLENRIVRDNPHGIISISLGGCEQGEARADANAERSAFDQADALGESVFVASGDSGAYECLTENWGAPPSSQYVGVSSPASMPGVTAVGGTRLSVNPNGSWYAEQVWEEPAATGGTGGGVSGYFERPSWQRGPGLQNTNGTAMRKVPDVAATADPLTSITVDVNGQFIQEGGTSQAAPLWAGMTALFDQYLQGQHLHSLGFLNPALYAIAAGHPPYAPFHDITVGGNLKYSAGPGYDMATGLGTPDAWNLVRDLALYQRQRHL